MIDEFMDVVDENDKVIGKEKSSKCHREKLLHRSSTVIVFKDDSLKEILLEKRSANREMMMPGRFCLPGGHLKVSESYHEACKREFEEEMFFGMENPENLKLEELFKLRKNADDDPEFITVFKTICAGPFNVDLEESAGYQFFDADFLFKDIEENPDRYTGTCRVVLEEYIKAYLKRS